MAYNTSVTWFKLKKKLFENKIILEAYYDNASINRKSANLKPQYFLHFSSYMNEEVCGHE